MNEERSYVEEEGGLVFGSRTVLVPGRKVEIGFSVRKKSAFPVVQELVLKLLRTVGGASLKLIVQFFDFSEKEIRDVIAPLLERGYVIEAESEYRLSEVGVRLFTSSDDGMPAISESESLERNFLVDDHCGLPVEVSDIGRHLKVGALKWFIEELQNDQSEDKLPNEKTIGNFCEFFAYFIRNQEDLERIRSEKLSLHKTEYVRTKDSLLIRVDVQGVFAKRAIAENRVMPFDSLLPRTESRRKLRDRLIDRVKTTAVMDSIGEIGFLRGVFGDEFLEGYATRDAVAWFRLVPRLFNNEWPAQISGESLVVGDVSLSRNIAKIIDLFEEVISEREVSVETPLRIVWVRPAVASWGRSIGFLDSIGRLRDASREVAVGAVSIELWEQSGNFEGREFPWQRAYEKWFDKLRRFSSEMIPPKVEMLLIGEAGGIVLTHAYTPPGGCFPCPLGVFFGEHANFQNLMASEVHGGLRSLPRLAKKKKKPKGKSGR